jgi:hypothetical protein
MTALLVNNPDFAQNPKLGEQTAQACTNLSPGFVNQREFVS